MPNSVPLPAPPLAPADAVLLSDRLADVNADQVDGQVAILTAAIAATQTRHDALSA